MKLQKIMTVLVCLLLLAALLSGCVGGAVTTAGTENNTTTTAGETTTEKPKDPGVLLEIPALRASPTTSSGDVNSVLVDDADAWKGLAGDYIPHSIVGAFETPVVITKFVIRTSTVKEDAESLRSATLEASADGENWTVIKKLGSQMTADKIYNVGVDDETHYSFFRLRQSEENITKIFTVTYFEFYGVAQAGDAPDIADVVDEVQDDGAVLVMKETNVSQTDSGAGMNVFLDNDQGWTGTDKYSELHYVIATFNKTSRIRKLEIKIPTPAAYANRVRGAIIEASTDAVNWTKLATLPGEPAAYEDGKTFSIFVNDPTEYSYLRIKQSANLLGFQLTVPTILVWGDAGNTDTVPFPVSSISGTLQTVTVTKYTETHSGDPTKVFDPTNTEVWVGLELKDRVDKINVHSVSGEFAAATYVTKVVYKVNNKYAARARSSLIQVSVDGVTWKTIATLSSSNGEYVDEDNNPIPHEREYIIPNSDEAAYKFIRIVQSAALHQYHYTLGTLSVYGFTE